MFSCNACLKLSCGDKREMNQSILEEIVDKNKNNIYNKVDKNKKHIANKDLQTEIECKKSIMRYWQKY